jgi:hypothetical protein
MQASSWVPVFVCAWGMNRCRPQAAANITQTGPTSIELTPTSLISFGSVGWTSANGSFDGLHLSVAFFGGPNGVVELNGTLGAMCASIQWSNNDTWTRGDDTVENVTIVYMVHLDVGFTNLAANVCDLYFNEHFPKAFNTSRTLRARGGEERYLWTEFTWLVAGIACGGKCSVVHVGCTSTRRWRIRAGWWWFAWRTGWGEG